MWLLRMWLMSLVCCMFSASNAYADAVIVLNSVDATISLIDQETFKVLSVVPTGKEPHHMFPTPDGKSLIVANSAGNQLLFLDPKTGQMQRQLANIIDPYQLAFSPDQKWFVTTGNRLDRIDIYSWDGQNLKHVKAIAAAKTPSHIAFSPDSQLVFVTLQDSDELIAITLATQTIKWKIKMARLPAGLQMTGDGKYLLVGMTGENFVDFIDWQTARSVARVVTGKGAHNFRPMGDKRHVFVSNRVENTISLLDTQERKVVYDIKVPSGPDDMELSADGKMLWLTARWARQLCVVDLASRKVIHTVPLGRSPHGLYFHQRAPWQ